MPNENNIMSLKTAPLKFASFTPVQYTPQTVDYTAFARSMAAQEAREEKANQYLTLIDNTLGEKRKLLNKEDYGWLAEQADDTRKEVDKQLALGNWQSAIRVAQQSAKNLARNTELEDRIKANEIYTTERNKIQSGNYSSYTKRRWDAINKYKFNGTADWNATFQPVADMSISDIWNIAVSRAPTRSNSVSSSRTSNSTRFVDNKGNIIKDITEKHTDESGNTNTRVADGVIGTFSTTSVSKGSSSAVQEKRASDIINIFNDLLNDSNVKGALRQEYDNMLWLYNEANKVMSDPNATQDAINQAKADLSTATKSLSNKDGFMYAGGDKDFEAWVNAKAAQYAKDSAYKHTSRSSSSSVTTSYNDSSLGAIAANRNAEAVSRYSPSPTTTEGPNITYILAPEEPKYNAGTIMNLLNKPNKPNKPK